MTRPFANLLRSLLFISLALLLLSCDALKPQPPLKVATDVWPGYESFYLAKSLGYYQNLPIKMVELPSATEVSYAFYNHLIDVAGLTLDEVLTLAQYQDDIRVIAVLDVSNGGDVLLANPKIRRLADIKGKRIGVENLAVGAILLDAALSAAKLTPADIQIIALSVDEHIPAYQQHKIDALVTFEPVKSRLQALGAKNIFDSSQIPNRIIDVLVTRQKIIEERPELLKQLLRAHFKALADLKNQPKILNYLGRLGSTPAEISLQFNGIILPNASENLQWLKGDNALIQPALQKLATLMWQRHLLAMPVAVDKLTTASLLPPSHGTK